MKRKAIIQKSLVIGSIFVLLSIVCFHVNGIESQEIKEINNSPFLSNQGNILYVGGSGPGNYTKIQDAIDNASDGDTVFVYDDSSPYYEWDILIDKSINLIGEDRNTTVIDGYNNGVVININSCSNVNIIGFTINDGGYKYDEDILILIDSCDNCIISNNFLNNTEPMGIEYETTGVSLMESNNIQITYNIIYDGMGIELRKSNDNTIAHNKLLKGQNVFGDSSRNNILYNDFSYGYGIELYNSNYNNIYYNNITNITGDGVDIWRSSYCDIYMNNIKNCDFSGIHFDECSNTIIRFNNIKRNKIGVRIGVGEGSIYSNNFIKNLNPVFIQEAGGEYFFDGNYWNKPMILPKMIIGLQVFWLRPPGTWGPHDPGWFITIPKLLFDMNPASEPYDIPGWDVVNIVEYPYNENSSPSDNQQSQNIQASQSL